MRRDDFSQDVFTNINIPDEMLDDLVSDLKKGRRHADVRFRYSSAIMALIILGVVGLGSFGASAAYMTYKNRIRDMSEEEKADYAQELSNDEYNTSSEVRVRDLTQSEYERYLELEDAYYKDGVFPQNILKHVKTLDEIAPDELAFVEEINKINMPEGELTDEQLLQLIDHQAKYIYTLEQNAEKETVAAQSEDLSGEDDTEWPEDWDEPFMDDVIFEITPEEEAEAKKIAFDLLKDIYDETITDSWYCSVSGNDFSSFYDGDEAWIGYDVEIYESDAPNATTYQITIPRKASGIMMVNCCGRKYYSDLKEYTRQEAEAYVDEGKKAVCSFLKERFGLGEPDSYEISGFKNLEDEDITSSEIYFHLNYDGEDISVDWNINSKQITGFAGRGLLAKMTNP
jgi:hypothetical protein